MPSIEPQDQQALLRRIEALERTINVIMEGFETSSRRTVAFLDRLTSIVEKVSTKVTALETAAQGKKEQG